MRFIFFFLLIFCNPSFALGIGDATLKSHLGEPLIAKINIIGVEKSPDVSCFSVSDSSDVPAFRKAIVTLQPVNDGYQLTISTHETIIEPIINLHVAYHCDPNFNRDYVLLLDPAPLANDTPDAETPALSSQSTTGSNKFKSQQAAGAVSRTQQNKELSNTYAAGKDIRKKKNKNKASMASSIDDRLMEAYTGKQQTSAAPKAEPATNNPAKKTDAESGGGRPRLTISGSDFNPNNKSSLPDLALRLETQIDFSRVESTAPLSTTETMDELTVMANRLAHMEKQITSLQQKNSQLQSDAEQAKKQLSEQKSLWLRNLLIAIGLIALLIFAEWLRRKLIRDRLDKEQDHWFESAETTAAPDHSVVPAAINAGKNSTNAENSSFDDSFFEDSIYNHSTGLDTLIANTSSIADENSDEHENILESADVFIEHGRPNLAIQLLQNHLGEFPSESPKVWIKLLNLLASDGSETEYALALAECSQYYNIKMPGFAEAKDPDHSSIEDFPNIVKRLEGAWSSPLAVGFLNDLIYNQQSQPIEGFGRETFEELFLLKQIAKQLSSGSSKEHDDFYQLASIKPKLDNMAFNEATFGENNPVADLNIPERTDQVNEGSTVEPNIKDHKISADEIQASIERSPFQTLPSYDVDLLSGFDDELGTKNVKIANENTAADYVDIAVNTQPNLAENKALAEVKPPFQAAEIDFSQHMQEIARMQDVENEALQESVAAADKNNHKKNTKETNLIEWDLPEIK